MSRLVKIKSGESSLILDADRVVYAHEITGGREIIYIDGLAFRTPVTLNDIAAALIPVTELPKNSISAAGLPIPGFVELADEPNQPAKPAQSASYPIDLVQLKQALAMDIENPLADNGELITRAKIYLSTAISMALALSLRELDITTLPKEDLDSICSLAVSMHMKPHY